MINNKSIILANIYISILIHIYLDKYIIFLSSYTFLLNYSY